MLQHNRRLYIAVIFAAIFSWITPVFAGDRALVEVIGYSADERYFAFEEYGILDGSGSAYSNIYIVDLSEDRWVVGTPIQIQADDEGEGLHSIRARARALALPRFDDLEIYRPAQVAAFTGDGEPDNDGLSLSFGLPGVTDPNAITGKYDLSIEIYTAPASAPCLEWFADEARGFLLVIKDFGASREAHRDRTLPRSRGCPITYKITGVYLPFEATDISRSVALISVYSHGFEGANRRFVAVPLAFTF